MESKKISIRGARVNNLDNLSVDIPRDKLVIVTGISGSGKSSLAFDTVYAEGYRRFVESLSSYARMFLGQSTKPDVDSIEGLSPCISIDQKTTSKNPRSTVGTVTEIYDYLRLLYSKVGVPHCPVCGKAIQRQNIDTVLDKILSLPEKTRIMVASPVVRRQKGTHKKVFEEARKKGFVRVRVNGSLYDASEEVELDKNLRHNLDIIVDRLVIKDGIRSRLSDSVETALQLAEGNLKIVVLDDPEYEIDFSMNYACEEHGISFGELSIRSFSFNTPLGACPKCSGIGSLSVISPEKILPDLSLSLRKGAIQVNGFKSLEEDSWNGPVFSEVLKPYGVTLDTPLCDYPEKAMDTLLYGTGDKLYTFTRYFEKRASHQTTTFEGILAIIQKRAMAGPFGDYYSEFYSDAPCPECDGARLKKEMLSVTVGEKNIYELCSMQIKDALDFINSLSFTSEEETITKEIIKELRERLGFLIAVGLEYLTLARKSSTLSGGEAQRIRLATQIGSSLVGVTYILDEPSIGLHQRDNSKLISTLKMLRDLGNTVIVVEHDEETMLESDYIIDIGPGAGIHGGKVVAKGTPKEVMKNKNSITGAYLSGDMKIEIPKTRSKGNGKTLTVYGASENNLKNIDVSFPLGELVCVTGVSGSGKSSLVNSILHNVLSRKLNRAYTLPGKYRAIDGIEHLDKVITIDQSPIGRTPRSNPATYTGLFSDIRNLFAMLPEAKAKGYTSGRFSFNVKGGRCEACEGDGVKCIEMQFLPDVYVTCDTCKGKRYNRETLEVKYRGKSIADVLDMTIEEAMYFFESVPKLYSRLKTMYEVGLGFMKLGQSSTTLSGGEAQRVKLATELSKRSTGKTMYILDEPTTGLHTDDVKKLIKMLRLLADDGNSVIVIEHNLDLIKTADYIIDLGPEGGDKGGTIVAQGTPEEVALCENSYTGQYLKKYLSN